METAIENLRKDKLRNDIGLYLVQFGYQKFAQGIHSLNDTDKADESQADAKKTFEKILSLLEEF